MKHVFLIFCGALIISSCANPINEIAKIDSPKTIIANAPTENAVIEKKDSVLPTNETAKTPTKQEDPKVPDFTALDVNDQPITLSNFYKSKKVVLIDFWASWCKPCRLENPNVVAAYNKFKSKGFDVFAISMDATKAAWLKAIAQDNLTYTHVSDLKYWDCEYAKLYGIQSIPSNFLIDNTGKLLAQDLRGEDLEKKLEEVLK